MELDLQPGDVVKVLESAALGWVRARVIRVKSGGRVVVQSDQGLPPLQSRLSFWGMVVVLYFLLNLV